MHAFIYLLYLITLFANIKTFSGVSFYMLIGFGIYFIAFEMMQMLIKKMDYFGDFWNVFDLSRTILLFVYFYMCFEYELEGEIKDH